MLKEGIKVGAICLVTVLSACYPARTCRHNEDGSIYECRVTESFLKDIKDDFLRSTYINGNCIVDGNIDDVYTVLVDNGCDGTVDLYMDGNQNYREEFGSKYDSLLEKKISELGGILQVKSKVGGILEYE